MSVSPVASSAKIQSALDNLGIPQGFIAYDTVPLLQQLVVASGNSSDGDVNVESATNITTKFRDAFENYTPGTNWNQSLASGDLVYVDGNAAAASYLVVSKNPLVADTQTTIESTAQFAMPIETGIGASMSQRTLGQEFSIEVVDTGSPIPVPADIPIVSLYQTGTTLTIDTTVPHLLSPGRAVGISGSFDGRVAYPSLVVATVTSPTQFTVTAGPGGTIPSTQSYLGIVAAATTAALPANAYANGASGVGATLTASANGAFPAQDGVTLSVGSRLLVKNEVATANNGVYVLTTAGSVSTPWVLTRAVDFDTAAEMTVVSGVPNAVAVHVTAGTTQALRKYILAASVATVGTSAVTFTDVGATGIFALSPVIFSRSRLGQAQNGISQIFENATATNASLYIRSESGDALPSGTVAGNQSATIGTTASIQIAGSVPYTYSFTPTNEFRMVVQSDRTQWSDSAVDAVAQSTNRLVRTQVCPDPTSAYELRIRANNNRSLTVPGAQIITAVKSGTTTATVTTATAHGLTVGDLIVAYGTRDQTNFANLTTAAAVASVVDATTFTVVWGAVAVTATTRGGFISKILGQNALPGAITQVVSTATLSTLSDGTRQLTLVGSGTWAGAVIGDLVELIGVRADAVGSASLGVDGPWKVANLATTTLVLVLPFSGQRSLPADFAVTNAGGGLVRRTDLRLSYVRIFDYDRLRVEMLARPTGDIAAAAPVAVQNTPAVTISSGTVTTVTTLTGSGVAEDSATTANPLVVGGVVRTAMAPTTLVAGDAARITMTAGAATVTHPYSIPEVSWQTPAPIGGIANTTTSFQIKEAAGASLCNYVTSIDLLSETLTNATDLRIREPDLTCSSQTIASNTLTVSTTHNLRIGDAVVFTASTVTGISTGVTYFVLTTPATTTITLSATRGGSTLAISGTGVTATFQKVLWQTRIPTTGRPAGQIVFPAPLRGSVNTNLLVQTATASGAGAVFLSAQGFAAQ
jgi:hypothetical protein